MKIKKLLFVAVAVVGGTLFSKAANAQAFAEIQLYEDNFGDLSSPCGVFGSIAATQPANVNNPYYSIALGGTANLKNFLLHPTASFTSINDRARSGRLSGTAGRSVTVFDSPDGKTNDDYTVIEFKTTVTGYYLDTFEKNYEDSNVKVTYVRKNGLDGKVSAIRIQ